MGKNESWVIAQNHDKCPTLSGSRHFITRASGCFCICGYQFRGGRLQSLQTCANGSDCLGHGRGRKTLRQSATACGARATLCIPLSTLSSGPWFWSCGQTNISCKIVNGKVVEVGKWPWQVSILFLGMYVCSGSLIHHHWILTAAHCLQRSAWGRGILLWGLDFQALARALGKWGRFSVNLGIWEWRTLPEV